MAILSKSREQELRNTLHFLEKYTREHGQQLTESERVAIYNLNYTICDLLCIDNKINGCYLDDLRKASRTELKF